MTFGDNNPRHLKLFSTSVSIFVHAIIIGEIKMYIIIIIVYYANTAASTY